MDDDTETIGRVQRALDAVQRATSGSGTDEHLDVVAVRHLLDEYAAAVRRLRLVVIDVETRLHGVADALKAGAGVVRREVTLFDSPPAARER